MKKKGTEAQRHIGTKPATTQERHRGTKAQRHKADNDKDVAVNSVPLCLCAFVPRLLITLCLCAFVPLCLSLVYADFEDLGMGARAQGMGDAFVGLADDSRALYYNPAGLAWLRQGELSIDYYGLHLGLGDDSKLSQNFISYIHPMHFRKINLSQHVSDAEQNLELSVSADSGTTPDGFGKLTTGESGDYDTTTTPDKPVPEHLNQGSGNYGTATAAVSTYTVTGSSEPILDLRSLANTLRQQEMPKAKTPQKKGTAIITRNLYTMGLAYRSFALGSYYKEETIYLSYARRMLKNLALGMNLKLLKEGYTQDGYTRIDPVFNYGGKSSLSAFSTDIGVLFSIVPRLYGGLAIQDFNQPDVGLKNKDTLPVKYRLGIGLRRPVAEAGFDVVYSEGKYRFKTGAERWFHNRSFAARCGLNFGPGSSVNISMGGGLAVSNLNMDYGLIFPVSGIEGTIGSHRISLVYRFGLPPGDELEPGSLELAYLEMADEKKRLEKSLNETQDQKQKLEQVLVEEATRRIREKIETTKELARREPSPAMVKAISSREETKVVEQLTAKTHYVASGDTLQSLAVKYYKDPKRWVDIYNNNRDKVRRGGNLRLGDVLIIPDVVERKVIKVAVSAREQPATETPGPKQDVEEVENVKTDTEVKPVEAPVQALPVVPVASSLPIPVPANNSGNAEKTIVSSKPKVRNHKVVEGDNLRSLAERYYQDPKRWKDIYDANPGKFLRDEPKPGETLVIP